MYQGSIQVYNHTLYSSFCLQSSRSKTTLQVRYKKDGKREERRNKKEKETPEELLQVRFGISQLIEKYKVC